MKSTAVNRPEEILETQAWVDAGADALAAIIAPQASDEERRQLIECARCELWASAEDIARAYRAFKG